MKQCNKTAFYTCVSTLFLQVVLILMGIATIVFLLWEPQVEGRNAHATLFEIYFNDPFLAYVYGASTPFFMGLYEALALLGAIRKHNVFSKNSLRAVRTIKYCAISLLGFITAPLVYLLIARPGDDIAGGVAMGVSALCISAFIAAAADVFERALHSAVDRKAEQDLTI